MYIAIAILVTAALVCIAAIISWISSCLHWPWGDPGQYQDDDLAPRYGGDEFDPPAYSDHHKGGLFAGRGSRREKS